MNNKDKLNRISYLCISHIGDKHSLIEEIKKIVNTRNTNKK